MSCRQKASRRLKVLSFAFLALCFLGCKSAPVPKVKPSPVTTLSGDSELAGLIESIRVQEGLVGLASAVIVNGKIHAVAAVGTREYGTDNWINVDDKFLIGSCTKSITASLAAILVDEGILKWQTTIRDLFPNLKMLKEYENINIAQLLSHRAGLPKNYKNGKTTWLIEYDFDDARGSTPEVLRLQYLENTVQDKLIRPQGEMVYYSNSGYILAGTMMEKATGRSIEDLMVEKIFIPLEIFSAGYGPPAALEPNQQPLGHYWDKLANSFIAYRADFPIFFSPAGYMHMNMKDWANFILMHMDTYPANSDRLINPDTLQRLHKPPDSAKWEINIDLGLNYAMGWFTKTDENGHNLIWHGGRGFNFNAQAIVDLYAKSAILIVSTSEAPNIHPQTHILRISEKIKSFYSGKIELPSII